MLCICCGNLVESDKNNGMDPVDAVFLNETKEVITDSTHRTISTTRAENRIWNNGVVGNISAGFGSNHDGCQYVIAICDECIDKKAHDGSLAYIGNYFGPKQYEKKDRVRYIKIWKRYMNLNSLLS